MNIFEVLRPYRREILDGLLVTLKLCAVACPLGVVSGTVAGVAGAQWKRTIGVMVRGASLLVSGLPLLLVLVWLH